ncbi:phosphomannomutase/phosphoglucomutase [Kitasatospora sp. NPDC048545]|uniref:phosphomannomutase/phosphoglucomutase n=1 Tax=Kitasatospora sp. NPDC048545 TaxID=3157208 RepID=UPI0033C3B945
MTTVEEPGAACHPAIKTYDIRGRAGSEVTPELARATGEAFVHFLQATEVIVGHDMRPTSPELAQAFAAGVRSRGADVLWAGLTATDVIYFASGTLGLPAAMITASHNPASDNGIKLTRAGVGPIARGSGLEEIHSLLHTGLPALAAGARSGTTTGVQLQADYTSCLRGQVDLDRIRPLRIVADAGNGMAGLTWPPLLAGLPVEMVELYFELDGTFPNHDANPMEPANLRDLQQAVVEHGADLGLAFDGDGDRCFVVDELGQAVPPCALLALLACRHLADQPGGTVVHDLLTSHATTETIREHGGVAVRSRVGHAFVKAQMQATDAILGGEASGHYYFGRFWHADSGPLAALHTLAAVGTQPWPASELFAPFTRYVTSGEINIPAADPRATVHHVAQAFPGATDLLDGLTVTYGPGRWFNLRASNVDPVVRLTIEAGSRTDVGDLRRRVLSLLPGGVHQD